MKSIHEINSYLSEKDLVLEKIIESIDLPEIESTHNVFNDLLSCVIEQQIQYRSTKNIFRNLLHKADLKEVTIGTFEQFDRYALIDTKLSMKKQETIHELVDYFSQHSHDWSSLKDEHIEEILSSIKGTGDWTIKMILLYTLQRNDIFPYSDFHLKKIMTEKYAITSKLKKNMVEIADQWKPYSSFATRYLLEFKKQNKI